MYIFTKDFWNYAGERALKTIAQVMVATLTATTFIPTSGDAWIAIGTTSGIAGLVSILTSLTAYSATAKNETTVDADVKSVLALLQKTAVPAPTVPVIKRAEQEPVIEAEIADGEGIA